MFGSIWLRFWLPRRWRAAYLGHHCIHWRHTELGNWEGFDYENLFRFHQRPLQAAQQVPVIGEGTGLASLVCMLDR